MSTNLVSTITQLLSSNIISRIASSLGLEKAEAQTGVEAGVPALLAALTSLVSKPGGASALSGAIAQQQPGLLSDLSKVIGSSAQEDVMKSGMSAMSSLLGGSALSSLTSALGRYAGLGNNASQGLMGLLGPVVMGALGQAQRAGGLDANGLANLLQSQKGNIASALPTGMSKYLSGSGILDGLGDVAGSASTASARAAKSDYSASTKYQDSSSSSSWLPAALGALALLAIIGIAWNLRSRTTGEETATTTPAGNSATPSSTGTSTGVSGTDILPAPFQALDNLRGIKVGDTDVGAQLANAVAGMRSSLSSIHDTATAQSVVQPLTASAGDFSRLSKMLDQLSPDTRKMVVNTIIATRPMLDQLCDKALAIPGVSAMIKPTVDSIRSQFDGLSTA